MSPSANDALPADFALFCNPESRRVEGFAIALGRALRERPKLIPWLWLLEGHAWEPHLNPAPRFLRLESPGRNWPVEQKLLLHGAGLIDDDHESGHWRQMSAPEVTALVNDPGRILPMRQSFLAWRRQLSDLAIWASRHAQESRWLCPPEDVVCMFDKAACQTKLEAAGITVPPALGVPRHFDELWGWMQQSGLRRVFLKPCHGSSASGVVALEAGRNEIQAFSTVELVDAPDGLRLYNRRRIKVFRGVAEVRRLVDAIISERCLAQAWVPKAGLFGHTFDLRVVVIGGRARHVMMRLGSGPMTNSQLGGGKGDVEALRQRMGEEAWSHMLTLCEDTMTKCFPRSLYAGLDVLIEPNFQTARILEVNAFGDLLPRQLHEGRDTYTWEIEAALRRQPAQVPAIGT